MNDRRNTIKKKAPDGVYKSNKKEYRNHFLQESQIYDKIQEKTIKFIKLLTITILYYRLVLYILKAGNVLTTFNP